VSPLDLAPLVFQELLINNEETNFFFLYAFLSHLFSSFILYRPSVHYNTFAGHLQQMHLFSFVMAVLPVRLFTVEWIFFYEIWL